MVLLIKYLSRKTVDGVLLILLWFNGRWETRPARMFSGYVAILLDGVRDGVVIFCHIVELDSVSMVEVKI